ncbi:MAG: glycosyltransferase family 9 protein [Lentimicrobiaceae bacterium]|nr:glycosyltransferase family 9 protein [Lentimicrobiaceae bacterium]
MEAFLIIQTASIGDVILVTPVLESIHAAFSGAAIDLLVKKGNETLFTGHPFLRRILSWDKSCGKYKGLIHLIHGIRRNPYDHVINIQRFGSSGLITGLSKAKHTSGFTKNPFALFFTHRSKHLISKDGKAVHEVDRNLSLIDYLHIPILRRPVLYPSHSDEDAVKGYKGAEYICLAPASLWFTKQFPADQWIEFTDALAAGLVIYLIGSSQDRTLCQQILSRTHHPKVVDLAGKLSLLETAALMRDARMNFVNDSAPQHLASAVNAPVSTLFCSTIPAFGFGPLSDHSFIIETQEQLACRPCGIHGHPSCPEKHFKCALSIQTSQLLEKVSV